MCQQSLNIQDLQSSEFHLENNTRKIAVSEIFSEKKLNYINASVFYVAYFNLIPHTVSEEGIDCKRAGKWILDNYSNVIKDTYYTKRYFKKFKKHEYDDIFYILSDDLLINLDTGCNFIRLLYRNTPVAKVEEIQNNLRRFRVRTTRYKPEISIIVNTHQGLAICSFDITKPKIDMASNYNDDFMEIHKTIFRRLSQKKDKGLVLLHGQPGTGKTTYIRYLITTLKKNVILLPPNMAHAVTDPGLIEVLIDNPNSILVIEDAENIVMEREKGNSSVSALLNISDGLLSDCLNIQIICTFNVDISKVDTALLRKGRLIAKYEFNELEVSKARSLSARLGFKNEINEPMTLTSIYNQHEKEYNAEKKRPIIGFTSFQTN